MTPNPPPDSTGPESRPGRAGAGEVRAVLVDDDPMARARLLEFLVNENGLRVVASCADGVTAVDAIRREAPDVVFLDVQMPGLDGFGVVEAVGVDRMPAVVFTSAYAEFAVRAFEAYALDYILKPYEDARLRVALARARRHVADRRTEAPPAPQPDQRLSGLLDDVKRGPGVRYPDAVAVKSGRQYVVVRATDIDWIEADGNYARLHTGRTQRVIAKSLAALEQDVLDPTRFVRVHRSAIVNVEKIAAVEPHAHGEQTVVLHDGARVECSRRYRHLLEQRMYFTT